MTCIESVLDSQTSYVSYFAVCYAVSVISWIVLLKFFVFYTPEQIEKMRQAQKKGQEEDEGQLLAKSGESSNTMTDTEIKTTMKTANFGGRSEVTDSSYQ